SFFFFFQAEDGIRDRTVTGVQTCALPISALPKVEETIGNPLSPYAAGKYMNELYAGVFARCYGMETIGLRYFNVFGPRQDPDGRSEERRVGKEWRCRGRGDGWG